MRSCPESGSSRPARILKSVVFPGGSFHLGLWLGWMQIITLLRKPSLGIGRKLAGGYVEKRSLAASMKLPLIDADRRATGHDVPFWRRWLTGAIGNDEFWRPLDHTHRISARTPPLPHPAKHVHTFIV